MTLLWLGPPLAIKGTPSFPLAGGHCSCRRGFHGSPIRHAGEGTPKEEGQGTGSAPRSYVLRPVDGRLRYLRRGRDVREGEAQAVQEADVGLDALSLHLSSASPTCFPCAVFQAEVLAQVLSSLGLLPVTVAIACKYLHVRERG